MPAAETKKSITRRPSGRASVPCSPAATTLAAPHAAPRAVPALDEALAAVPAAMLAPIPDGVSDAQAAALPTAGLTALRSLEVAGLLLGRRVLVTGATGGVGRIAVQLAQASGAHVTALVRAPATVRGADAVVQTLDGDFDLIVDAVGGATFGRAIGHLARRGLLVNLATPEDEPTVTFTAARFDRS